MASISAACPNRNPPMPRRETARGVRLRCVGVGFTAGTAISENFLKCNRIQRRAAPCRKETGTASGTRCKILRKGGEINRRERAKAEPRRAQRILSGFDSVPPLKYVFRGEGATSMDMDWISVVSAAAAWAAAWHAFRSSRTAHRAYKLALERERRASRRLPRPIGRAGERV